MDAANTSKNENASKITQLNIEIELLKRTLSETEEELARVREEYAQSKANLMETTESLSKARAEAAVSARDLREAQEAPPVLVKRLQRLPRHSEYQRMHVIQSDHIQESVLRLRQQLESQTKKLQTLNYLHFREMPRQRKSERSSWWRLVGVA